MKVVNPELESQVLAAMINDQENLDNGLAELSDIDFSDSFFRHVFKAIKSMYEADKPINSITVYKEIELVAKGKGTAWMALKDAYWPSGTFTDFVARLKKLTKARRYSKLAQAIITGIENRDDIDEIAIKAENDMYSLSLESKSEPVITPKEQASRIMDTVAKRMDDKERNKTCIFTSFKKMNYVTGGFEAGDLVIVSGPTGGGKTAFTMNLLRDIAMIQKLPCLYINTEMSAEQIDIRWASILSRDWGVNNRTLRAGDITDEQYSRLSAEIDPLFQGGLYSITIPDLTIPKMLSTIRRFAMQKKIRAVAIDYIGRMDMMANKDNKEDWKMFLGAAQKLKTIGQQFGLVSFMLSQVDGQGKLALAKYMQHEADLHLHVRPMEEEERLDCLKSLESCWNYAVSIEKGRSAPKGFIPVRFVGEKLLFISDKEVAERHAKLVGEEPEPRDHQATAKGSSNGTYRGSKRQYRQD